MPFTLSHAILAPPIAKMTGYRLPVAALAIGCMTPDLYRLLIRAGHDDGYLAHYWSALLYPSLCVGMGFTVLWYLIYRPVIYRFIGIEHAIPLRHLKSWIQFSIASCLALLIGICSHILWDGLTHADFRTLFFKNFLAQNIRLFDMVFPLHRILQVSTSVISLPILLWMLWAYYQRYKTPYPIALYIRCLGWGLVLITILSGWLAMHYYLEAIPSRLWQDNLYSIIGMCFNEFSQTALWVFTLGCMIWRLFIKD
ncbi:MULTISPECIES: DUF4184 family protein [unclassified Acinetobacter]|uniref:DUF4184 family protein n=1 Tax=unclassified Acinetobacter TaxID=196816 RepID=UPI0029341354|nr:MULTISPECIES: DUF4184 family protein [unclassified Acinetobacter]WOE30880.1 DUF4184 family protein [Acinetobacter sp. SAAs470]WOE39075.1 DUF4184 family protein [Acinetobacter sp. SAAs474]